MRVYRDGHFSQIYARRSLTVCEGVSAWYRRFISVVAFPHCMWGCIIDVPWKRKVLHVPSLYVRVYHKGLRRSVLPTRSLTVCEGVSRQKKIKYSGYVFPHCMWGCIASYITFGDVTLVPSLYVRVYRAGLNPALFSPCSLTVCEGVSQSKPENSSPFKFPHCMWGCIEHPAKSLFPTAVPSLYVRVYRLVQGTPRR